MDIMKYSASIAAAAVAVYMSVFLVLDADMWSSVICALSYKPKQFTGQVVWITGASSGIGAELARELSKQGAQVVLSARREKELNEVAVTCNGLPPAVIPLDVTDMEAQKVAYNKIVELFGRVDVLILNAGRSQRTAAEEFTLDMTREIFELNFMAVVNLVTLALPAMIERKSGHLVVMSSVAGKVGTPIASSYSATKYALLGYFDGLRAEVSQFNISVLNVCPGPVQTDIAARAIKTADAATPTESEGKKMPVERCVQLIVRAMYNKGLIQEIWIAQQPILLLTYINTYFPWISRLAFTKLIGPARRKALKSGTNVYDFKAMLGLKSSKK